MPREMFEERIRANKPQYYAWERQKADRVAIGDLNESEPFDEASLAKFSIHIRTKVFH